MSCLSLAMTRSTRSETESCFPPSRLGTSKARFLLHVGVDVDHKIIVVLKGAFVILSLQALEHMPPASRRFRQGARGLDVVNGRLVFLVLKIAEEDVLDYRLIGRTFGDNSEFEHTPPRR